MTNCEHTLNNNKYFQNRFHLFKINVIFQLETNYATPMDLGFTYIQIFPKYTFIHKTKGNEYVTNNVYPKKNNMGIFYNFIIE